MGICELRMLSDLAEINMCRIFTKELNGMVERGFIEIKAKSGLTIKVTANNLGDGLNRLISFFKDLKKEMEKQPSIMDDPIDNPIESYAIEQLLTKHQIDLEGL